MPCHVLTDRRLTNVNAEFEEFSMHPGSAPQRVGEAHGADQLADFERHLRSAVATPRLPSPERTKTSTMPADNSLRLNDHQGIHNARRNPIEAAMLNLPNKMSSKGQSNGDHHPQNRRRGMRDYNRRVAPEANARLGKISSPIASGALTSRLGRMRRRRSSRCKMASIIGSVSPAAKITSTTRKQALAWKFDRSRRQQ